MGQVEHAAAADFIASDREEKGLAALEGLSLEQLAEAAARVMNEADGLQKEAVGLSRRSTRLNTSG